jgi:hypothetical protein
MSSAHDAPGGSAHPQAGHDAHDAFDGEPATALPADEPRSPAWLPLLGLALFLGAGVYFLVGGDDPGGAAEKLAPMELQAPPAPQAPQAARAPQAAPPGQPADNALRKMTPQQMEELRKKVEAARAAGQGPGQPAHP